MKTPTQPHPQELSMPSRRTVIKFVIFYSLVTLVYGGLVLWGYKASREWAVPENAWWTDQQGGIVGGAIGASVGLVGAMVGVLGGLGFLRRFVLGLMLLCSVLGVSLLIAGIVALCMKQPYGVWYAILHPGFIMSILFPVLYPVVKRGYAMRELHKMQAMDVQGG